MAVQSSGNCYLCGKASKKGAMKTHLLKDHNEGNQECWLVKAEGRHDKNYWIYFDIPKTSTLKTMDGFLRDIWLECCGHLSGFSNRYGEVGMGTKLAKFSAGDQLLHEYDFGSTTELQITFMETIQRPKQQKAVRLLSRNQPQEYLCHECKEPAQWIDTERMWDGEYPFVCEEHLEDEEMCLPVVNSPRMGECGYDSDPEQYLFHGPKATDKATPQKKQKAAKKPGNVIQFPSPKETASFEEADKIIHEFSEQMEKLVLSLEKVLNLPDSNIKAMAGMTVAVTLETLTDDFRDALEARFPDLGELADFVTDNLEEMMNDFDEDF